MNNYVKTLAIAGIALSLGACQATTMGKMGGGILGAGLGALGGSQFGKGTGKTIATAAGALLGAGGGAFVGNSLAMPYENRTAINGNTMRIGRNGQRITENGYRIDQNGQRIDDMGNRRHNYDGTPVIMNNNGGGAIPSQTQNRPVGSGSPTMSNYGCKVQRNYVICNSN